MRLTRELPLATYTPVDRRLVVEMVRTPNQTEGGILIPDQTQWNTGICRVLAVGPDCKQVKRGDFVLVSIKIESSTIRFGGRETYVAEESHILGVLTTEQAERVLSEQLAAQEGQNGVG